MLTSIDEGKQRELLRGLQLTRDFLRTLQQAPGLMQICSGGRQLVDDNANFFVRLNMGSQGSHHSLYAAAQIMQINGDGTLQVRGVDPNFIQRTKLAYVSNATFKDEELAALIDKLRCGVISDMRVGEVEEMMGLRQAVVQHPLYTAGRPRRGGRPAATRPGPATPRPTTWRRSSTTATRSRAASTEASRAASTSTRAASTAAVSTRSSSSTSSSRRRAASTGSRPSAASRPTSTSSPASTRTARSPATRSGATSRSTATLCRRAAWAARAAWAWGATAWGAWGAPASACMASSSSSRSSC